MVFSIRESLEKDTICFQIRLLMMTSPLTQMKGRDMIPEAEEDMLMTIYKDNRIPRSWSHDPVKGRLLSSLVDRKIEARAHTRLVPRSHRTARHVPLARSSDCVAACPPFVGHV